LMWLQRAIPARAGWIAGATEKPHRRARAVSGRDARGLVFRLSQ